MVVLRYLRANGARAYLGRTEEEAAVPSQCSPGNHNLRVGADDSVHGQSRYTTPGRRTSLRPTPSTSTEAGHFV